MALESGTYISDLNPSNPVGATDKVSTLDDHVRLIKATLQTTFPGIEGAVTASHVELNHLDGVTGTTGTGKLVLDDTPTIADLTVTDSITLPADSIADAALSDNVPLKDAPNTFTAPLTISTNNQWLYFLEADAGEDEKLWRVQGAGGGLLCATRTDEDGTGETWLSVQRNGVEVTEIELNADVLDFNGNADISGSLTVGGVAAFSAAETAIRRTDNTGVIRIYPGNSLAGATGNARLNLFSGSHPDTPGAVELISLGTGVLTLQGAGGITLSGNTTLTGTLNVSGATTVGGALTANGNVDINANLDLAGATVTTNISMSGTRTIDATTRLNLTGSTVSVGESGGSLGFYGAAGASKPTVGGKINDGTALIALLNQLESLGLITKGWTES